MYIQVAECRAALALARSLGAVKTNTNTNANAILHNGKIIPMTAEELAARRDDPVEHFYSQESSIPTSVDFHVTSSPTGVAAGEAGESGGPDVFCATADSWAAGYIRRLCSWDRNLADGTNERTAPRWDCHQMRLTNGQFKFQQTYLPVLGRLVCPSLVRRCCVGPWLVVVPGRSISVGCSQFNLRHSPPPNQLG
jgi:hypothetical protein